MLVRHIGNPVTLLHTASLLVLPHFSALPPPSPPSSSPRSGAFLRRSELAAPSCAAPTARTHAGHVSLDHWGVAVKRGRRHQAPSTR